MGDTPKYGDEWDVRAGRAEWFLKHGHGRRRRSLPIFPGYGYLSAGRRPRTIDSTLQEVSLEAIDLARGIGEAVEVWRKGEDGEELYQGVAKFDVFKGGVVFIPTATEIQGRE